MEHVLIPTLVVITLLQLCRAQSSDAATEWYAANDINDTSFSPKPITELFSTETSFSPENPIVVLTQSTPPTSNRGVVSSPTPISQNNESTFPPNVIPLSSTESPPPTQLPNSFQSTSSGTQPLFPQQPTIPNGPSTTQEQPNNLSSLPNQGQPPRVNEIPQNLRPNQTPSVNRLPPQQVPPNMIVLAPPQMGNRIINPTQQLPPNFGQPNYFVLYQQVPQTIQNMPSIGPQTPQQVAARPPNMRNRPIVQQSQMPNQFFPQSNSNPRLNIAVPLNIAPSSLPIGQQLNNQTVIAQQPNNQTVINQQPNNQPFNQPPVNQQLNNPQLNNQFPFNQPTNNFPPNNQLPSIQIFPSNIPNNVPVLTSRPRQRNRVTIVRNNVRGRNQLQSPNTYPCPGSNATTLRTTATGTKNPVITIRVKGVRPNLQTHPNTSTVWPSTVQAKRQISQMNSKNYDRCLNSCRDRKDRICAAPEKQIEINLESLKGFPSMCHMACHNTFRGNPIYEKVTNGRCGKLRTRIQTVDKEKVRRDELKKSQYTIISNVPGTVVELAP